MRIWSLHPTYLDAKGLVALWRETLLAKHVLEGKTKGYTNHPQLDRFKESKRPLDSIHQYLSYVHEEAVRRGYTFDEAKFNRDFIPGKLTVTTGQLNFEVKHLSNKLFIRDLEKYKQLKSKKAVEPHPLFEIVEGEIEKWEVV